ncbi:LacI family DNA-binding transcriptional regulator [Salipiger pacificus]|uniref:LacI family DNA-binding transcriptional regulator n=2 Tax=Salipiger mangrovisoli TaxID=2865933 RepID=A0ABR9WYE0_9RHOB|nr:LacI family DNA-binding transcriptional regulator [Salipiger mangrovisoli]
METVGRLAGVSQVTVSRALSDPSKVSPATLAKIHEAIAQTGFVPNALAGALASSKSMLISALVPSITNIVYSSMVKAFSEEMRREGYEILLSETGFNAEEEEKLIAAHLSRRPDAMFLTGIHHSAQARRMLLAAEIPVAEVWDITDSPIDFCVGFNHAETGRAAADFARRKSYPQVGVVSAGDERARRRSEAFLRQWHRSGEGASVSMLFDAPATLANGRAGFRGLLDKGFTGGLVHCSSDLLAHGVIIEAQSRGLDVPGRIAVLGFGDQPFADAVEPRITTVRVDMAAFGRAAAQSMLARLGGDRTGPPVIDLGFEIVEREST